MVVKRVVGLEGDLVELDVRRRPGFGKEGGEGSGRNGKVVGQIVEEGLEERNWDLMGEMGMREEGTGKRCYRVPWGHVWVEGDNWRKSRDSNYYGPVSPPLLQKDRR